VKLLLGGIAGAIAIMLAGSLIFVLVLSPAAGCTVPEGQRVNLDALPEEGLLGFDVEQLRSAGELMNAASDAGLGRPGQLFGVMKGLADEDLRGVTETSASSFVLALAAVPHCVTVLPAIAINTVTGSADPLRYSDVQPVAEQLVARLSGLGAQCATGDLRFPLSPGYQMTSGYGWRGFVVEGASYYHVAVDLQHYPNPCGDPVFAIMAGTVTFVGSYTVSIKSADGISVSYLHMYPEDVLVQPGQAVAAGQQIGGVGSAGPSKGCHLDLRINVAGTTNVLAAALPRSQTLSADIESYLYDFVHPEEFYRLYGLELCPESVCVRLPE